MTAPDDSRAVRGGKRAAAAFLRIPTPTRVSSPSPTPERRGRRKTIMHGIDCANGTNGTHDTAPDRPPSPASTVPPREEILRVLSALLAADRPLHITIDSGEVAVSLSVRVG